MAYVALLFFATLAGCGVVCRSDFRQATRDSLGGFFSEVVVSQPLCAGVLRGQVVLSLRDDRPDTGVSGVLVERLARDRSVLGPSVTTEASGAFSFGDVPDGTYLLRVAKDGFNPVRYSVRVTSKCHGELVLGISPTGM
jgi:hypothetical protein